MVKQSVSNAYVPATQKIQLGRVLAEGVFPCLLPSQLPFFRLPTQEPRVWSGYLSKINIHLAHRTVDHSAPFLSLLTTATQHQDASVRCLVHTPSKRTIPAPKNCHCCLRSSCTASTVHPYVHATSLGICRDQIHVTCGHATKRQQDPSFMWSLLHIHHNGFS